MRRRVGGWNIALERLLRGDRPLPPLLSQALHIVLKHREEIAPSRRKGSKLLTSDMAFLPSLFPPDPSPFSRYEGG